MKADVVPERLTLCIRNFFQLSKLLTERFMQFLVVILYKSVALPVLQVEKKINISHAVCRSRQCSLSSHERAGDTVLRTQAIP